MLFKQHPSEALILSVLNGTAPATEQKIVHDHFAVCPRCSNVAERHRLLLQDLKGFSEASASGKSASSKADVLAFPEPQASKHLFRRIAGGAVAAVLFGLIFAWPRHIQTVSAAELLSRAEKAENATAEGNHFYRLHAGSDACDTASPSKLVSERENLCDRVHGRLLEARWDDRDLVSARSYRQWHDGLQQHHDSVLHEEPYWTIRTDTDEGVLRSASLRVRSSDYHPVELTLVFTALETVSAVEDVPAEKHISIPAAETSRTAESEPLRHVEEPADSIEVQAWNLLRTLDADSGWEATITRRGNEVRVTGFVRDKARQEKFKETFISLPAVTMDLNHAASLPQRGGSGEAQPLAEHTLETLIPDAHERSVRTTQIADASRAVLGKAYLRDQLIARRRFFEDTAPSHALSPLIEAEQGDLLALTVRLSDLLDPLVPPAQPHTLHEPLSYAQARRLDAAVLALVNAAPKQSASLEETTGLVRTLLSKD